MNDLRKLAEEAKRPNLELRRYNHGGGRLADFGRTGKLTADFYDEAGREFYAAASPDVILGLLDRIAELESWLRGLVGTIEQYNPEWHVMSDERGFFLGHSQAALENERSAARSSSKVETGVEK